MRKTSSSKKIMLILAFPVCMLSCGGDKSEGKSEGKSESEGDAVAATGPEAEAKAICDCYTEKQGGDAKECDEMYAAKFQGYKNKGDREGRTKFYDAFVECQHAAGR